MLPDSIGLQGVELEAVLLEAWGFALGYVGGG